MVKKSDLRYHGKPNIAENVLEDQITRAVQYLWELIKRPREALEHGITTEEAIPWATETALSTIGTGTKFPLTTTPGRVPTKISVKKADPNNIYATWPEGRTDTSVGSTSSYVVKHGDNVLSVHQYAGAEKPFAIMFHKGEHFGTLSDGKFKIGDVNYYSTYSPVEAFETFKKEIEFAKKESKGSISSYFKTGSAWTESELKTAYPTESSIKQSTEPKPEPVYRKDMLKALQYETLPDWNTWEPSTKALEHGFNIAAHHGTNTPIIFDKFELPKNELGVHFGTPKQALDIQGHSVKQLAKNLEPGEKFELSPRIYPAVIQAKNPIRLSDLGVWTKERVGEALYKTGEFDNSILNMSVKEQREALKAKGYDSVVYENKVEGPGYDSYIKFDESPHDPGYVTGVRSPWASFDPGAIAKAGLTLGIPAVAATSTLQLNKIEGNPFEDVQ